MKVLTFDLGASSGRAMLFEYKNGAIEGSEIHRFKNAPQNADGTLRWDFTAIFSEIKTGIKKAAGGFDAVSIDTWGVDFGLLDESGNLLEDPICYRDAHTKGIPDEVFALISKDELYSLSGIQFMRINTLYRLYYLTTRESNLMNKAHTALFMPDLIAYFLTGNARCERTNASTSNLLDAKTHGWYGGIFARTGIKNIFPPFIDAGESYGNIKPELCEELSCKSVPVIAVGSHDTASAVVTVPAETENFAYISSGTWSLFGTELKDSLVSGDARRENFTNELGVGSTVRFLKNIMGLWIIQQLRAEYGVTFAELEDAARSAAPFAHFIDVDDAAFELPGEMSGRIRAYCERTGQKSPETPGEAARCVYDSLAMKYKTVFDALRRVTGKNFDRVHIVGGGIKDAFLAQLAADAMGVTVETGPAEATATGNAAVALIGLGEIENVAAARRIVRACTELKRFSPSAFDNKAYEKYLKTVEKK